MSDNPGSHGIYKHLTLDSFLVVVLFSLELIKNPQTAMCNLIIIMKSNYTHKNNTIKQHIR